MTTIGAAPVHGSMGWRRTLERTVAAMGCELVDVERGPAGLLRVTIDRAPGHAGSDGVGVDDCEAVSRQLQYLLEVEAVDYARLEVSSPGLDRALKKPADWERFVGSEVEVTLREPFQNRRKWRGQLAAGAGGTGWRLLLPGPDAAAGSRRRGARPAKSTTTVQVPALSLDFSLDEVREARLVPVIDFKRRRALGPRDPQGSAPQAAIARADGGQE